MRRNQASHELSRPNKRSRKYKSATSKDEFLDGLEEVLAEENGTKKGGDDADEELKKSVFEFDPDEEEKHGGLLSPQLKKIRVGDLKGTRTNELLHKDVRDIFSLSDPGEKEFWVAFDKAYLSCWTRVTTNTRPCVN